MTSAAFLAWSLEAAIALILLGMTFAFLRLLRGPSLPDRVVALDLVTTLVVTFVGAFSIKSGQSALMDVIVAVALIAFLATLAYARYTAQRPWSSDKNGKTGEGEK